MTFGELCLRLQEYLQHEISNAHLTVSSLATTSGYSSSHVREVLRGSRPLSVAFADAVLSGLQLSVEHLLTEKEQVLLGGAHPGRQQREHR